MATQSTIPVLVTRPEPQASRFAAELTARFGAAVRPVVSPLMATVFLEPDLPDGRFSALVLTSEAGALAAGRLRKDLPDRAYCVGDRTAEVAAHQGFTAVSAAGDVTALAMLVAGQPDEGPLLYLHGEDRAADLAQLLGPGRSLYSVTAYAQRAMPLSAYAETILMAPGPVILPLFSPRSTALLVAALPAARSASLHCVAISPASLSALPHGLAASTITAEHPDGAAMLQAISRVLASGLP